MPTYEDIAFKVIVKNDGISDIIFKTLMLKGEAGGTISSIEKTATAGLIDTYTITLNDGTTTTFEVTNGSNIESIEKTSTAGLIDTYTVTLTNGDTSTFEVKNGEDAQLYELPKDCVVGYDKEPTQTTVTSSERYIQLDNVNGISSVKYNGNTLQETNDGRNLFNKDNPNEVDGYIGATTFSTSNQNAKTVYIAIDANTTYTVSKTAGQSFIIATSPNIPSNNVAFTSRESNPTGSALTITSGASDAYLWAWIFLDGTDTGTLDDMLASVQIEKGSTATPYQPYCGGIPSPNPSYPQDIVGVGEKQQDNTYSVDLVAEDADGNVYTVTASGLTHPVYQDDWIDLVAGKLHRGTGYVVLSGSDISTALKEVNLWRITFNAQIYTVSGSYPNAYSNKYKVVNSYSSVNQTNNSLGINNSGGGTQLLIRDDTWTSLQDIKDSFDDLNLIIVYPLATPTEESITLTGDLEQVKRIRGEYAYIDAPLYASTDITFGQDIDFPDGYEEIDFPLDDLFYYQDQEFIEFPTSWGFVMGYVFDASEIRFTMNVTKDLKQGMSLVANKSVDLALNLYTGSGGDNLTGFNFVDASFIREYGQIQIRLKTENPHGLALGSLLGARVSQGRLRITFEAPQEE